MKDLRTIEEILRDTGEFVEEDIRESARFVKDYMCKSQEVLERIQKMPPFSEMIGLKQKTE